MHDEARYGHLTERHLLGIIHYLATWSLPAATRVKVVAGCARVDLQDLLGAVRPFLGELEFVLDSPDCGGKERTCLEDFVASYEAALAHLDLAPEEIPTNWDVLQLTGDRKLNRALFHLHRGRDVWGEALDVGGGARSFLKGLGRLRAIQERRTLPAPIRRVLKENELLESEAEMAIQHALVEDALERIDRNLDQELEAGAERRDTAPAITARPSPVPEEAPPDTDDLRSTRIAPSSED